MSGLRGCQALFHFYCGAWKKQKLAVGHHHVPRLQALLDDSFITDCRPCDNGPGIHGVVRFDDKDILTGLPRLYRTIWSDNGI